MTKNYFLIMKSLKWHHKVNQQEIKGRCSFSSIRSQRSSETARRKTFQFNDFLAVKSSHKIPINNVFLTWFIGFVEGDGSFVISHNKVYFDLTQDLKDIDLLYKIKATLGFGKILTRTDKHRNVGVFYVTGKDNFIRLAHLFNGNLVTEYKKKQFKAWLHVLNKQYSEQIQVIESCIKPSFTHCWLSGFIDAEGYFAARVKQCHTSRSGKNVFIDFAIFQKQQEILVSIRNLFNIETQTNIRFDPSWKGHVFYLSNKKLLTNLIVYLKKCPLKTKKCYEFRIWAKIHKLSMKKIHLTERGLKEIIELCNIKKNYKEKLKVQSDLD